MSEHDQPAPGVPEPPADAASAEPTGLEKRLRDAQAALTRKSMEAADLRRRLEAFEADEPDDGDDADDAGEPAPRPSVSSRFRAVESPRPQVPESEDATGLGRSVAEAVHGADVVADYDRAMQLLQSATTTADRVTAFQAFADLRARAASPAERRTSPAERRTSRDERTTPVVQTNRPDTIYVDETDPGRYVGGQNDGVRGFVKAILGRDGSR